jgi:hypothetical protein
LATASEDKWAYGPGIVLGWKMQRKDKFACHEFDNLTAKTHKKPKNSTSELKKRLIASL